MSEFLSEKGPVCQAESSEDTAGQAAIQEDRVWNDDGWTALIIKNEDDDGWAVAMYKDGQSDPALVGPWTMGRDKKNPKPLDATAFATLVKTASEVIRRHEQHHHALLHKSVTVTTDTDMVKVRLDIVPEEDDPHAILSAEDRYGEEIAKVRVRPDFKLTMSSAAAWIESGYRTPARSRSAEF